MYLSLNNKTKVTPPLSASTYPSRYQWLSVDMAEPNLGVGTRPGPFTYALMTSGIGERFWTRFFDLSSTDPSMLGVVRSNVAIFDSISATNLITDFSNIVDLVLDTLASRQDVIRFNRVAIDTLTAFKIRVEDWEKRINLGYLDQSGAEDGQVPVWNGFIWAPDDKIIEGFPGMRLHDFVPLSTYAPGLCADYSFCGVGASGAQVTHPAWRIVRLRYSDGGLVDQIGVSVNAPWTERYIREYFILTDSNFYFNTFGVL